MEAASRWLGVRAALAENPVFATHSPLQVELWDRLLAYGAALGVAAGASRPLPMGVESDTEAWTTSGGRWRRVRITYPRYWPPGWGADPLVGLLVGLALVVGLGLLLYTTGPSFLDAGVFGAVPFTVACIGVVLGAALAVMAASDWRTAVEVTGSILRLRTMGDEDKSRYYIAVDDGESEVDPRLEGQPGAVRGARAGRRDHRAAHEESLLCALDRPGGQDDVRGRRAREPALGLKLGAT